MWYAYIPNNFFPRHHFVTILKNLTCSSAITTASSQGAPGILLRPLCSSSSSSSSQRLPAPLAALWAGPATLRLLRGVSGCACQEPPPDVWPQWHHPPSLRAVGRRPSRRSPRAFRRDTPQDIWNVTSAQVYLSWEVVGIPPLSVSGTR